MSREDFTNDWVPYRDALLSRYPKLTDADLEDADGSTAELARLIAGRQGIEPGDAQQDLHEFLAGPMPADAYSDPTHDNAAVLESKAYVPAGEDPLADDRRFGDDDTEANPVGRDR
ncbi:hypothetical protein MWU52_07760 [Jannaschia sp. S6380]|uniref:hypothetical protein n=1 Tax=Jannaschia sp. S6380 TaxID=2926408 RepID=UPI001FF36748|nr:hypothetical protein [Jannaschia sp. S6380]MCK0167438.1 hypothetical protein [Jannaschia sp. S6380]